MIGFVPGKHVGSDVVAHSSNIFQLNFSLSNVSISSPILPSHSSLFQVPWHYMYNNIIAMNINVCTYLYTYI